MQFAAVSTITLAESMPDLAMPEKLVVLPPVVAAWASWQVEGYSSWEEVGLHAVVVLLHIVGQDWHGGQLVHRLLHVDLLLAVAEQPFLDRRVQPQHEDVDPLPAVEFALVLLLVAAEVE